MASLDDPRDLDLENLDFGAVRPQDFARIVKELSAGRIDALMDGPRRRRVLDEVFGRMRAHFRPAAAGGRDALIRWRITGGDGGGGAEGREGGGGGDVYETRIAHGTCTVTPDLTDRAAQLSLTMAGPEFLRLVSGNVSGPALFFGRRLKLKGDIRLAGSLKHLFDIPRP